MLRGMNTSAPRASRLLPAQRRPGIDERAWKLLEPCLPGRQGGWGGIAHDNRAFIDAVFWVFRTGASWRDLPPDYGDWKNTHRRFCRWRDKGLWEPLLEVLVNDPDHAWLITGANSAKAPPHDAQARKDHRHQAMRRAQEEQADRYAWPWLRLVCRSEGLLQKLPARIQEAGIS
jgi:transposase